MITVTGTNKDYIAKMEAERGTVHASYADIPEDQGGSNAYLRPGETLLSALGACMNITARKYLNRDMLPYEEVRVLVDMKVEDGVTHILTKMEITGALAEEEKARIIQEVSSCPVCNILGGPIRLGQLG